MASNAKKSAKKPKSIQEEAHHPGADQHGEIPLSRGERRRQQFEQKRVDRKQAPAKQQREQRLLKWGGIALAALLLLGVGYGAYHWLTTRDENRMPEGITTYNYTGGEHSNDAVAYTESPPVGGTHNPVWQTCTFYDGKIASENAVHSLEHGAVWITYQPDISDEDKARLENWADDRSYLMVSEYEDQESPFVFTAWNNQLSLDSLDDKRATQFMNYFIQGPQTPERGASCTGIDTMLG
ncbi:MAG: DUF3105 domain-containing protein [Thermomicrobiales bacterium]|nr:DUF3105 domain-containing protein [Thermomicrobiales bacterium]MCO5220401.1 DUF3105 domain-containing protein [Thermomicrobiales bacterium]